MLYYVQNMRDASPQNNQGSDLPLRAKSAERKYIMGNRKNPVRFAVDFASRSIIGTKTSLDKAKRSGSPEYKELCKLLEAHPKFKVVEKEIKTRDNKQTYKKLSFDFIESYISIMENSVEIKSEYERVKELAASSNLSVYPFVKSWFLRRFSPDGNPFNMKKAMEELVSAGLATAQDEAA